MTEYLVFEIGDGDWASVYWQHIIVKDNKIFWVLRPADILRGLMDKVGRHELQS